MFNTDRILVTAKMKRGDAGLPRRKVCIRAVHHIIRVESPITTSTITGGEATDECPP
jgi:hypothetical protein